MAEILNITKTAARAYQAWPLLVWAATHRQIVTYKYMAALTGMGVSGVGSVALDPIWRYCNKNNYPALTVIVVGEDGVPGTGVGPINVPKTQMEVFGFDWLKKAKPPTIEILEEIKAD